MREKNKFDEAEVVISQNSPAWDRLFPSGAAVSIQQRHDMGFITAQERDQLERSRNALETLTVGRS